MKNEWFCFYVFLDCVDDIFITSELSPLFQDIEKLIEREPQWFFIRYWEAGPHLRIRVKLLNSETTKLKAYLEQYLLAHTSGKPIPRVKSITYKEYHPEINRYGDQTTINWAEKQFVASSKIVVSWLNELRGSGRSPFLFAIRLHLTMFYAMRLTKEEMVGVSELFCNSWIQRLFNKTDNVNKQYGIVIDAFEDSFLNYRPILSPMAAFWNSLEKTIYPDELRSFIETNAAVGLAYRNSGLHTAEITKVYASFMHMTHNRLGIKNREEAFIAFLLKKCIYHIYEKR